ncbi:MAG: branched-chain amino acid ABC transporter permease [Anaerolineae bacterium]|nr:MAG: branched-chain amino acid ABC transporter permease [Anaerolineae bacterium]
MQNNLTLLRHRFQALPSNQQQLVAVGGFLATTVVAGLLNQVISFDLLKLIYLTLIFITCVVIAQWLFNYIQILPRNIQIVTVGIIALTAPFILRELEKMTDFGLLTQVNRALIFVALAQGLNVVVGFAGLLDLGYAAFFAIGAYTFGILTWPSHDIELSFFLAIWVCAVVASIFGMIIGAPTLRLRGDYLAIVTLAFGEIIPTVVRNLGDFSFAFRPVHYLNGLTFIFVLFAGWLLINLLIRVIRRDIVDMESLQRDRLVRTVAIIAVLLIASGVMRVIASDREFELKSWELVEDINLTGGSQGLTPLGKPSFRLVEESFGMEKNSLRVGVNPTFWYYAIIFVTGIILVAARRLDDSRLGRAWKAVREDETAADFMGVDPIRTKLLAFAIGASFSGLAGAVYASMLGAIFPELFRFQVSITLLIIVVLSGRGSVWGVLVGGLIISIFDGVYLAQVLPDAFPDEPVESLRWVFFGAGLLFIMVFRPQGLFPVRTKAREQNQGANT